MKYERLAKGVALGSSVKACPKTVAAAPPALPAQPDLPLNPSPAEQERLALLAGLAALERRVRENPKSAWAWYRYGDALLAARRTEQARQVLQKAVRLSPKTALFHYDLGLALSQLEQHAAAHDEFAGIVATDPRLKFAASNLGLSAMTNLALNHEKLGRRGEAIEALLPALETAVGILFNLGFLHYRARRYEAALPFASAAYLLRPNNEDVVHQYGGILLELNRFREAVRVLKLATELNPGCVGAWYDLGLAHARQKHGKVARKFFLKALEVWPGCGWAHYDLACLDALAGKRNAAFDNLMQAVARGFRDLAHLRQDADFRSLRRDARWKTLVKTLRDLEYAKN